MTLRQYQIDAVEAVDKEFLTRNRVLGVAPTGSGKTIMFAAMTERWQAAGERTLIVAHREELIDQAIDKLCASRGIVAAKEKAESWASLDAPVVVASVQTLNRRFERWPQNHFQKIIVDETHHILAPMYQTPLRHFTAAKVFGTTATPDRGDKKNLGEYFEAIAFEIGLFDLIDKGFLSRISLKSIPLQIDLTNVSQSQGDFDAAELGAALDPYLDQIAVAIRDQASFRRVLAFLPLIATSEKFVGACNNVGLRFEHIDGNSPDRKEKLARFRAGEFDGLSNAMLLTEGYDDPGIDCVVVLRPTRSRPLYAQMVGRGARIHEFKTDLLLLDFLWNHKKHAICRPAHLIAKSNEEAEMITAASQASPAIPADVAAQMPLDLQNLASGVTAQREEALRKRLEENRKKKAKTISAEEFAVAHNSPDLAEYEPVMPWESEAISPGQESALRRAKIDIDTVKGKGHANRLLDIHFRDQPLRLADAKSVNMMRRLPHVAAQAGITNLTSPTAVEAGRFWAKVRWNSQQKRKVAA